MKKTLKILGKNLENFFSNNKKNTIYEKISSAVNFKELNIFYL